MPPSAAARDRNWLGSMAGTARITGDLIAPVEDPEDWTALT
jgi:hypothetical protein